MNHMLPALLLTLGLAPMSIAPLATAAKDEPKIAIYIGPQTREGFVDVDSGVLDSITDVQSAFKRASKFRVVQTAEKADIVLFVVGRRTAGQSGSVGVPIGTMTMFLPIKRRAIDTILRVGAYDKTITSEAEDDDHWKASAKRVVKDVTAWVDANRSALARK
jgi:hypothetical protein